MELLDFPIKYDITPKTKASPFNSGKISKITYDIALKYMNLLRYTTGLSYNIGMTEKYNQLTQDASLLCQLNNKLAHVGHPKPKDLDKKLYDSGAKGCDECNLGMGHENLMSSVNGWASDEDAHNFPRVGHRRWLLNPTMKNTGFGYVGRFSAMYAFDEI